MTPGIFISYSREDEKQAMHLLALLRREGYSVWIDQEAIAGASIWSDEIVQNIKSSEIFIALLSASSVASANVAKEIALASEHGKTILPVEVGNVTLPGRLQYALAGIQRTNFHDEEAILRAVRGLVARMDGGDGAVAPRARIRRLRPITIGGVAIAVFLVAGLFSFLHRTPDVVTSDNSVVSCGTPFATLNLDRDSTRNLDIFSDNIITRLSAIATLKTAGSAVTSSYKDSRLNALAIAQELKARFIVEGLVRKSHDANFVSARVFDAKRGGEIWEQAYSGNNTELFVIRERVCNELSGFLHGLSADEAEIQTAEANVAAHPNEAPAVARLASLLIASDKTRAFSLFERAIKLDSNKASYYISAGVVAMRLGNDPSQYGRAAIPRYKAILLQHPDSSDLIASYMVACDMSGANTEHTYDSLLRKYPRDVRLNFNAACCLAKAGKVDPAMDILENLFTFAPGKKREVQSDPDFNPIRSNPRYQRVMYGVGK